MVSLKEIQNMMRTLYFHRDQQRGQTGTYNWFREEVDELGEALSEDDPKALESEFANVLAWLASLANIQNVDLETAFIAKYCDFCPKCKSSPCNCTPK